MLRDVKQIPHAPLTRRSRAALTVDVTGGRNRGGRLPRSRRPHAAFAQGGDAAEKPSEPVNPLAYIPADTTLLINGRPAEPLTHPDFANLDHDQ